MAPSSFIYFWYFCSTVNSRISVKIGGIRFLRYIETGESLGVVKIDKMCRTVQVHTISPVLFVGVQLNLGIAENPSSQNFIK